MVAFRVSELIPMLLKDASSFARRCRSWVLRCCASSASRRSTTGSGRSAIAFATAAAVVCNCGKRNIKFKIKHTHTHLQRELELKVQTGACGCCSRCGYIRRSHSETSRRVNRSQAWVSKAALKRLEKRARSPIQWLREEAAGCLHEKEWTKSQ